MYKLELTDSVVAVFCSTLLSFWSVVTEDAVTVAGVAVAGSAGADSVAAGCGTAGSMATAVGCAWSFFGSTVLAEFTSGSFFTSF